MKLKDYFQALLQMMEEMRERGKVSEEELKAVRKLTQTIERIESLCAEVSDKGLACSIMTLLEAGDSGAKFKGIVVSIMDEEGERKAKKKYDVKDLLLIDEDMVVRDFAELASKITQ